jgi:hypothetical protein
VRPGMVDEEPPMFLLCIAWLASAVLAGCDTSTMGEQPSVLRAPSGDARGSIGDADDGNANVSNDSGDTRSLTTMGAVAAASPMAAMMAIQSMPATMATFQA